MTGNLYFLTAFTHSTHLSNPTTDNHQSVLSIYEILFFFLGSTYEITQYLSFSV